jgi:hypothetical protein
MTQIASSLDRDTLCRFRHENFTKNHRYSSTRLCAIQRHPYRRVCIPLSSTIAVGVRQRGQPASSDALQKVRAKRVSRRRRASIRPLPAPRPTTTKQVPFHDQLDSRFTAESVLEMVAFSLLRMFRSVALAAACHRTRRLSDLIRFSLIMLSNAAPPDSSHSQRDGARAASGADASRT